MFLNYFIDEFLFCTGLFLELLIFGCWTSSIVSIFLCIVACFIYFVLCALRSRRSLSHIYFWYHVFLISKGSFMFYEWSLFSALCSCSMEAILSLISLEILILVLFIYFFLSTFLPESDLFCPGSFILILYYIPVTFLKLGSIIEKVTKLTTICLLIIWLFFLHSV